MHELLHPVYITSYYHHRTPHCDWLPVWSRVCGRSGGAKAWCRWWSVSWWQPTAGTTNTHTVNPKEPCSSQTILPLTDAKHLMTIQLCSKSVFLKNQKHYFTYVSWLTDYLVNCQCLNNKKYDIGCFIKFSKLMNSWKHNRFSSSQQMDILETLNRILWLSLSWCVHIVWQDSITSARTHSFSPESGVISISAKKLRSTDSIQST